MDLTTTPPRQLQDLVASMPANKRAAFSKAAKAASQHLRDSRKNYEQAYALASAMVKNWWHLGQELPRLGIQQGGHNRKSKLPEGNLLSDLGINANQSARCQKLAEKSAVELDEWLESKYDPENYWLPSLRPAAEGTHVSRNSGENEWYTPPEIIELARTVLGSIDLDPATSRAAQRWILAERFYTAKQDGLRKTWSGATWLNPPYELGLIDQFVAKLLSSHIEGAVHAAIALTNNATETSWGQLLLSACDAVCFPASRIKFLDPRAQVALTPLQGQMISYFGAAVDLFSDQFGTIGTVIQR